MHLFPASTTDIFHTHSINTSMIYLTYSIHIPYMLPTYSMDIPYKFRAYAIDILYMCLTYSQQILHIFRTYSRIPTQIVSHVGPRGPVPGLKLQQAGPRPGPRRPLGAWSTRNVRGKYAEGDYPAQRTGQPPWPISPSYSIHVPCIF